MASKPEVTVLKSKASHDNGVGLDYIRLVEWWSFKWKLLFVECNERTILCGAPNVVFVGSKPI